VVHVHQACNTEYTHGNISHRRGRKIITNMRGQEKIKFKRGIDKLMKAKKVSSTINSVNH
jgi:hypothetical protein